MTGKILDIGTLPHSLDAERSILGAILLDNGCIADAETLKAEHFSLDSHRRIYRAILELWNDGVACDIVILSQWLRDQQQLEAIGGVAYLASLTDGIPPRANILHYVKIVHEKAQLRGLMIMAYDILARAQEQEAPTLLMKRTEKRMVEIASEVPVKDQDIFLDYEKFTNRYNSEIEWRVDGAIEVGTNGILVGASGDGKSPVARALAVCLASGVDWLDLRVKRTRTALISREDYPGTTSRFIRRFVAGAGIMAQEIGLKHWLYINTKEQTRTMFLDDMADLRLLINNLKSRQIEFAILDVWNKFHRVDENDPTAQRKILNCVEQITGEVGCQCLILHHTGRSGGIRGASSIDGFGECIWKVNIEDGEGDDALRKFSVLRLKSGYAHKPITFKIANQPNGGVTLERLAVEEKPSQVRTAKAGR